MALGVFPGPVTQPLWASVVLIFSLEVLISDVHCWQISQGIARIASWHPSSPWVACVLWGRTLLSYLPAAGQTVALLSWMTPELHQSQSSPMSRRSLGLPPLVGREWPGEGTQGDAASGRVSQSQFPRTRPFDPRSGKSMVITPLPSMQELGQLRAAAATATAESIVCAAW